MWSQRDTTTVATDTVARCRKTMTANSNVKTGGETVAADMLGDMAVYNPDDMTQYIQSDTFVTAEDMR